MKTVRKAALELYQPSYLRTLNKFLMESSKRQVTIELWNSICFVLNPLEFASKTFQRPRHKQTQALLNFRTHRKIVSI